MDKRKNHLEKYKPSRVEKLALQSRGYSCGTASLKNAMYLMFDESIAERTLWEYKRKLINRDMKNGISPKELAILIKYIGKTRLGQELKVFVSQRGTISQLSYLLEQNIYPIIHRNFHEGKKEGHYELVLETNDEDKEICLFNSARKVQTSGAYIKSYLEFTNNWWPNFSHKEKWYLAITPESMKLPNEFSGKYL